MLRSTSRTNSFPYTPLFRSYYEIQSLNDYGAESLEALSQAVERLRAAVLSQDHTAARSRSTAWERASRDRKSTRLNSSHTVISYAVCCLKKKKKNRVQTNPT